MNMHVIVVSLVDSLKVFLKNERRWLCSSTTADLISPVGLQFNSFLHKVARLKLM